MRFLTATIAILVLSDGIASDYPAHKWIIGVVGGVLLMAVLRLIDRVPR